MRESQASISAKTVLTLLSELVTSTKVCRMSVLMRTANEVLKHVIFLLRASEFKIFSPKSWKGHNFTNSLLTIFRKGKRK